jgi:exopolysaccharide biosynthesis polyprenyl glycosylphosphotransferase
MKNNASVFYAFALILGDFVALLAAYVLAYILRVTLDERSLINQISSDEYLKTFLLLTPLWLVIFAFLGLYRRYVYDYRWREISLLAVGVVIGSMALITYDFIAKEPIFPARLVPIYGLIVGFLLLVLERTILRGLRMYMWRTGFGVNRVLAIGSGEALLGLMNNLQKPSRTGFDLIAVATKDQIPTNYKGKVMTSYSDALKDLPGLGVNTVLVTGVSDDSKIANEALAAAQANHASYKFIPSHAGLLSNNIDVELFQGLPVVTVHQTALIGWGRIIKRLFDIFASGLAMILLSPVYIIIAIFIKLGDGGPVFFKQARLSRFNTTIYIFKFRSNNLTYNGLSPEQAFKKMGKPELIKKYRANGDFLDNDPRITKVGRFLRKTSLDELPQLYNVLRGDISLVGPRALMPQELQNYPYKNLILSVKSGITGLAQISGRRDIGFEERRALDLYYVQNWSFWMDVKILFRTVVDVLTGRGAK